MATGEDSARTVVVAVAANLLIALAKGGAALVTGSAAMAAETTHSLADTANEVLLFLGVRHSGKPPDARHPFGYGQARYLWSLFAAVGIFVVGGMFAIVDGVRTLIDPHPVSDPLVGVGVLLVSAALEGWSWRTARRQLRREAADRQLGLAEHLRSSSDPSAPTVFLEDSAALAGIAAALAALGLDELTGDARWDGVASLMIGVMLVGVAVLLVRRNGTLLLDEAAPVAVHGQLRARIAAQPWVAQVARLDAVRVGPGQVVVHVDVVPRSETGVSAAIAALRAELLASPSVVSLQVTPVEPPDSP